MICSSSFYVSFDPFVLCTTHLLMRRSTTFAPCFTFQPCVLRQNINNIRQIKATFIYSNQSMHKNLRPSKSNSHVIILQCTYLLHFYTLEHRQFFCPASCLLPFIQSEPVIHEPVHTISSLNVSCMKVGFSFATNL